MFRAAALALALVLGGAASAQTSNLSPDLRVGGSAQPGAIFTLRAGGRAQPGYFGSDDYEFGAAGGFSLHYLRLGSNEIGSTDLGNPKLGFGVRGSFRTIGERDASDHPELRGLNRIPFAVELGLGVGYRTETFHTFADVRYGVEGHDSWVAEVGADYIYRPDSRWKFRVGPRVFFGDDDYARTYFGVSPLESAINGSLAAYTPSGGALTAGLEAGATYMINDRWGVETVVSYSRFINDAADSPIVQQGSEDYATIRVGFTRTFQINW